MNEFLLSPLRREKIMVLCNKIIDWHIINQPIGEILEDINNFAWATNALIRLESPKDKVYFSPISCDVSTLIYDILEVDSITESEKEKEIKELIEDYKDELQDLAKRSIKIIENWLEIYLSTIEGRGFEEETFRRIRGDKEEWE